MKQIELSGDLFQGHVSLERTADWVKPWRIPYTEFELFPPNGINGTAQAAAGIRLRFSSHTTIVQLNMLPLAIQVKLDCLCDGKLLHTITVPPGETVITFDSLPANEKLVVIYLPQNSPIQISSLQIEDSAEASFLADNRPKWITYGSSITQCSGAASPALTWPAIVSRERDVHLTCLGFSGNCHLEPMVAGMIRDLPADLITLCVGINIYGGSTLGERTFRSSVIGFIKLIREKHQAIPIAVFSPILSPPRESTTNLVGLTLVRMREEIVAAVNALTSLGDERLHYINGLELYHEQDLAHMPDNLHPNAKGYQLMAENVNNVVMGELFGRYDFHSTK